MDRFDKILDLLNDMEIDDIIEIWNEYASKVFRYEDKVFYMSDFEDIFSNERITFDLVSALQGFNDDAKYFTWFRYEEGHKIKTFNNPYEIIDLLEVAEYIVNHEEDFGFDKVKEILYSEEA